MQLTDQELLKQIAAKDAEALSSLYDRYNKVVYGMLLNMLRDTDDAEDILQEVFTQVWRKADSYKPELGVPKNWLLKIAHNRGINLIRSRRSRNKGSELSLSEESVTAQANAIPQPEGEGTWEKITLQDESSYLRNALEGLPKEQRVLIDLAFFQGYSHSEIAEKISMPLGTVKTRIRSSIHQLRSKLLFLQDRMDLAEG